MLETRIRLRPYPEERPLQNPDGYPRYFMCRYEIMGPNGGSGDFGMDKFKFIVDGFRATVEFRITHFALPEDITTEEPCDA